MTVITLPRSITIPSQSDFNDEFLESRQLRDIGDKLIAEHTELGWLEMHTIRYLWKRKGVASNGKETLGKCIKPGGIANYFAACDWVVWLSAPACRLRGFTDEQIEALVFHELLHCMTTGEDDAPAVRAHDFEGFRSEVEKFGFWRSDLESAAASFQLKLGGME